MHKGKSGKEAIAGKPQVRIGKYGVTDGLVEEVSKRLKKDKTVKVKVLKSLLADEIKVEDIASKLAERTSSKIIDVRGHTFILAKYSRSKKNR